MRNKGWLTIPLVLLLVLLFPASCTKKVVKSQPVSMAEPEVQKAPEQPAQEAGQDGRLAEDRVRAEADARIAAVTAVVDEKIHFAFDSSLLSDQARQILLSKVEYLRTNPDITVTVEGHCDDRGTKAYNIALGERRAESVKRFLVERGIGTDRLKTVSYGEEQPIATGHDEDSWAKNRRAQFVIN